MNLGAQHRTLLDALTTEVELDVTLVDRPGRTVVGRDDRSGRRVFSYRAGDHVILWCDPTVVDRLTSLEGGITPTPDAHDADLRALGAERVIGATMYTLATAPPPSPVEIDGYDLRTLDSAAASTFDLVKAFTERCDADDVEEGGLDGIDDEFDEAAISVVVDDGPSGEHIVAYASACPFDWNPELADIGVLVHDDHRRRGLANAVVAHTTARLLADGRVPLYRHHDGNSGSRAVARANGFAPTLELVVHEFPAD